MKINPPSEAEERALRKMLARQMARRIIQRLIKSGQLIQLPNGRVIDKDDFTPQHLEEHS